MINQVVKQQQILSLECIWTLTWIQKITEKQN